MLVRRGGDGGLRSVARSRSALAGRGQVLDVGDTFLGLVGIEPDRAGSAFGSALDGLDVLVGRKLVQDLVDDLADHLPDRRERILLEFAEKRLEELVAEPRPGGGGHVGGEGRDLALVEFRAELPGLSEDGGDRLLETFEIEFRIRDGDVVEGLGDDLDILADVQALLQVPEAAAHVPEIVQRGRGEEALHGGDVAGESRFQRGDGIFQPVLPGLFIEEIGQVRIDARSPGRHDVLGERSQFLGGLGAGRRGFFDGFLDGGPDDVLVQFLDGVRRLDALDLLLESLDRVHQSGSLLRERIHDVLDEAPLDLLDDVVGLPLERLVHFLQQVQDLPDHRHQRLHLFPECLLRFRNGVLGEGEDLLTELAEQRLQQVAEGAEIRDVRIEEPGDVEDLGGDRLRVLDAVDRILLHEIGGGVREHLFHLLPPEGRDRDREGEALRVIDSRADILGEGAAQGVPRRGDLVGEIRDADGRQVHEVRGDVQAGEGSVHQAVYGAGRLLDPVMDRAGDRLDRAFRIGDRAVGVFRQFMDAPADGLGCVLDGLRDRLRSAFQGGDELLGKLDLDRLPADEAEEVQDRIHLGEHAGNLFIDIPDFPELLAVQGAVDAVLDLLGERVVHRLQVVHALAEEGLGHRRGLVGVLLELLEAGLDPPFDRAAYVLDGRVDAGVDFIGLELDILDLVGEHFPAVAEEGDEDVLQQGHDQLLEVELLIGLPEEILQFLRDLAELHVLEVADQLHEVLDRLVERLRELRIVHLAGSGALHVVQRLRELLQQRERLAQQVREILRVLTVADVQAHLRERRLDHLRAAFEDLPGGLHPVLQTGRRALGPGFQLFHRCSDSGKLLLQVEKKGVPCLVQQKDEFVGDVLEGSHGEIRLDSQI